MRTLREQISDKCVHFNGMQNKTCRAGVTYDEVDNGKRVPYRKALPCFKPEGDEVEQCKCEHLRFRTEEEIQARLDEHEETMRKMTLAQTVIAPIRKEHKGKDWRGVLECPNCKGKLHVSHSGYNNHVHAKCETPDCVAWME